jgi:Ca2+/Na+ antiporter
MINVARSPACARRGRDEMTTYRGNAIAVGILFIACSAASILSAVPLGSMLGGPDYLAQLAGNGGRVVVTALIEFIWAATGAGIAIGLYPVLRKHNRSLALGSVVGRTVENTFVLVGTLSLLALLTLGQKSVGADPAAASSYQAVGQALLAVRDWANGFLNYLAFCVGVSMYYYVLYRSRLVPRWLSGWGLVGAGLCLGAFVWSGFTQEFGFATVNTALNIPIGVQEMVLGVWLIAKGFSRSALASDVGSQG